MALSLIDQQIASYHPKLDAAAIRFRTWHVETLINQAADLLDRCLLERARFDVLRAQSFSSRLAFVAEKENLAIEEDRIAAGVYRNGLDDATSREEFLTKELAAVKSAYSYTQDVIRNGNGLTTNRDWSSAQAENHRQQAAEERVQSELKLVQFDKTRQSLPTGPEKMHIRLQKLAESQKELKRLEMQDGGALDFDAQAASSVDRVYRDYVDAVDRILVASIGLTEIYGYPDPFVNKITLVRNGGAPEGLDAAVDWVREAIRWLAAFNQYDQVFSATASLRSTELGAAWNSVGDGAVHPFRLPQSLFNDYRYVRLRGLSASTRLQDIGNPFPIACFLTVPKNAAFLFPGDAGDTLSHVIQDKMPVCTLGHVTDSRIPVEPEVCGAISLRNASPVVDPAMPVDKTSWTLRVLGITADALSGVNDILLRLTLAGQPRK